MLQALELFAADKGVRELKVLAASDAATFYERCGWKPGKAVGSGLRLTKSIAAP